MAIEQLTNRHNCLCKNKFERREFENYHPPLREIADGIFEEFPAVADFAQT